MATGAVFSLSALLKYRPRRMVNAEVLKIVRTDAIPGDVLTHLYRRVAGHDDEFTPVIGKRIVQGKTRSF